MKIHPFIRLSLSLSLIIPILFGYLSIDFGISKSLEMSFTAYIIMLISGIIMYNYLETGSLFHTKCKHKYKYSDGSVNIFAYYKMRKCIKCDKKQVKEISILDGGKKWKNC